METNEEIEYRNKLNTLANSLSDKMAVLEARDRLMRLKRSRQTDLATAVAVVGTCPDMCPELERYFREETNQTSSYELDSNGKADEHRMIKEYRRSGADQEEPLAHELRPVSVLDMTMNYLCTNIIDALDPNAGCGEWYDFVWSRTRSIRKDITQQHLCDERSVALTEKCARFHIHCSATLCEQDLKDFDPKINEENLSNCLQSLKDFYYDLSLRDIYCLNEPEFRCYEILLHLNDTAILRDVQNYKQEIRESSAVQLAVKVFFAYQSNNYMQFFRLLDQCSYLMGCVLHRYFVTVRLRALKIIRKSYTSNASSVQEYPAQTLIECLGFEDVIQLKQMCDQIGLECCDGIVYLIRGLNQNNVTKAQRSIRLVENKRTVSIGQAINGMPLPANPYREAPVHHSFDGDGRLIAEAIEALDQRIKTNTSAVDRVPNKPIFGTGITPKPFQSTTSLSGGPLFTSANLFFTPPNTSKQTFIRPEPKSNIFSLANNSSQMFPIQRSNADNNLFKGSVVPSDLQTSQPEVKQQLFNETITEINAEMLEKISLIIANELLLNVTKDLLNEICGKELKDIKSFVSDENICYIFSDILLNTSDGMIAKIAMNVIKEEMVLNVRRKESIEKISNELTDEMFDDIVFSQIRQTSQEVLNSCLNEYIGRQLELNANRIFGQMMEEMVIDISSEVHMSAIRERDSLVELMKAKKTKRIEENYWNKWKKWFLKRKRLNYLRQCFPAAPNWQSSHSTADQIKYTFSRRSFDENVDNSVDRELKTNAILNESIHSFIKEIASQVVDISMTGRQEICEYIQQKHKNYLQKKYFKIWRNRCVERRGPNLRRRTFPAAPDWQSSDSACSQMKYSFSDLSSDFKISPKRMRPNVSDDDSDIDRVEANEWHSSAKLRQLLDSEMSESKAFTKKLRESLNNLRTLSESFESGVPSDGEDERVVEVVEIFETESDKMQRLKRLLAEEKDYFSFQKFTPYLIDNREDSFDSD